MSIIGPRPCLYNQEKLINLRNQYNVDYLRPGITGYAQIQGTLTDDEKASYDKYYLEHFSLKTDIYIFFKTFLVVK